MIKILHLAVMLTAMSLPAADPFGLSIWPGLAPIGMGESEQAKATITVHLADPSKANGAAVVICPGGGYGGLVVDGEGHGIARWLNAHGIAGVVLEYHGYKGREWDAWQKRCLEWLEEQGMVKAKR